jgi:hypothetical protein
MRYFAYIAEQSFKTAPDGRRLFYRGGPWSRPFIIPNSEVEQRLFRRQLWTMRLMLGPMIFGQPFLFMFIPDILQKLQKPQWYFGYIALVLAAFKVVGHFVFGSELRGLERIETRMPVRDFYANVGARHSTTKLAFGLFGSLAFVACGIWILAGTTYPVFIGATTIVFFGVASAVWGFALFLRLSGRTVGGSANRST